MVRYFLTHLNVNLTTVVNGERFIIPIHRAVGLANRRDDEPWMTELLGRLIRLVGSAGLVDVGVNVGQTLLKLKSIDRALCYVGFEPNPICVSLVHELVRLNGMSAGHARACSTSRARDPSPSS